MEESVVYISHLICVTKSHQGSPYLCVYLVGSYGDLQTSAKMLTSSKREFPGSNTGNTSDELVSGYGDTCKQKPSNPALHRIQMLPEVGKTRSERFEKTRTTPPLVKTNSVESPTFPRKLHGAEFVAPTKQRVKLDKLSDYLFTSLSYISLSVPGQPYKNPMLQACKKMFRDFHMEHCFSIEQYESLMDVALPVSQSYIETTSISLHRDTLSSRKEWTVGTDFSPPDFKPLNQKPDGKREGISSLVFKVNLLKPEMREKHGKTVVLKVLNLYIAIFRYLYCILSINPFNLKVLLTLLWLSVSFCLNSVVIVGYNKLWFSQPQVLLYLIQKH